MTCGVLVPEGKIAMGKLSQAIAHGATLLQVDGNFDDCLTLARKLAEAYPVELVNSVNPARIEGQKTAAFEVVDALGDAPDIHCLPVGNAGNITAYWRGYREYRGDADQPGPATRLPQMWGFQAAGAAPIVLGHPVDHPETIATAIRIGNPASWSQAEAARDESGGLHRARSPTSRSSPPTGCCPPARASSSSPASAASRRRPARGRRGGARARRRHASSAPSPATGSRTPQWALRDADGVDVTPTRVPVDAFTAAAGPRARGLTVARTWPPGPAGRARGARARQQRQPRPRLRLDRPGARDLGHLPRVA